MNVRARWGARRTLYSQAMTQPTVGGLHPMPHAPPRRALRRVVLESVPRRDAAQRLHYPLGNSTVSGSACSSKRADVREELRLDMRPR